jgi:hypothetical protein
MKSKFFHISFWGDEIVDNNSVWDPEKITYSNVGISLNSIYLDEIIDGFGAIIVTEKLYWLLKYRSNLNGFIFELPLRYEKGYDFLDNYPDSIIPPFRYMKFTGVPLQDDFSFYQLVPGAYHWILSEKAVIFLLNSGMINAHGEEITGSIQDYFVNYEDRLKAVKYAEVMPRLFLKYFLCDNFLN